MLSKEIWNIIHRFGKILLNFSLANIWPQLWPRKIPHRTLSPYGSVSLACANPENFVRGGPTLTMFFFFLIDEGWVDPNSTISGPSWACHGVSLAC